MSMISLPRYLTFISFQLNFTIAIAIAISNAKVNFLLLFYCAFFQTYVFKLMNSSGVSESGESEKVLLLMESGVRLHTTVYMR